MKSVYFLVCLGFGIGTAYAGPNEFFECKRKEQTRSVEIRYADPIKKVPCEVIYNNGLGPKTKWRASGQVGYCEKNAHDLIGRLKASGWQCGPDNAKAENIESSPGAVNPVEGGAPKNESPVEKVEKSEPPTPDKMEVEKPIEPAKPEPIPPPVEPTDSKKMESTIPPSVEPKPEQKKVETPAPKVEPIENKVETTPPIPEAKPEEKKTEAPAPKAPPIENKVETTIPTPETKPEEKKVEGPATKTPPIENKVEKKAPKTDKIETSVPKTEPIEKNLEVAPLTPVKVEEPKAEKLPNKIAAKAPRNKAKATAQTPTVNRDAEVIDARSADSIEVPASPKSELEGGQIEH